MFRGRAIATCLLLLGLTTVAPGCIQDLFQDCDGVQEQARDLVKNHQACSAGDSCVRVEMGNLAGGSCLGSFQCSVAIHADTDLDTFGAQATALNNDYDGCPLCVMADCVNPEELTACCDPATDTCVLQTGDGVCPAPAGSP